MSKIITIVDEVTGYYGYSRKYILTESGDVWVVSTNLKRGDNTTPKKLDANPFPKEVWDAIAEDGAE
jgi:hypothetical protein